MTLKEKILDKLDDWKWWIRHYKNNVKYFFEGLERWWSYRIVINRCYDFDYSSIMIVFRHQLKRVRASLNYYRSSENSEIYISRIDTALRILDIIEEDGCAIKHGETKFIETGKTKSGNTIYSINSDDVTYSLPEGIKVNTRNAERFFRNWPKDKVNNFFKEAQWKDFLRVKKANVIFWKFIGHNIKTWWD